MKNNFVFKALSILSIVVCAVCICFSITSCTEREWPNEKSFFKPFTTWHTEDNEMTVYSSYGGSRAYGQVNYDGNICQTYIDFVTNSVIGFSSKVEVRIKRENRVQLLAFKKRRVKKEGYKNDYYNDRVELYDPEYRSEDSFWNFKNMVLYSEKTPEETIDARYLFGCKLVNKEADISFKSIENNNSFRCTKNCLINGNDYILDFLDNKRFSISGLITYTGTYFAHYESIELFFDDGNKFLNHYEYLSFNYESNALKD